MRKLLVAIVAAVALVGLTTGFTVSSVDLPDWLPAAAPGAGIVTFQNPTVAAGTTYDSPIFDVRAFNQLLVKVGAISGNGQGGVTVQWFKDSSGTSTLQFNQSWNKNSLVPTQVVLPVQGPFVQFLYTNSNAGQAVLNLAVTGLVSPVGLTPSALSGTRVVLDQQAQSVNAGTGKDVLPSVMLSGRAHLWGLSTGAVATGVFQISYWTGTAWDLFARVGTPASGDQDANLDVNLPLDDWRVGMVNTDNVTRSLYATVTMES